MKLDSSSAPTERRQNHPVAVRARLYTNRTNVYKYTNNGFVYIDTDSRFVYKFWLPFFQIHGFFLLVDAQLTRHVESVR